ncbi:MAG: hypothetical protein Q7U97_15620 [Rhodocyclaceae bacterium]|nr:hypothetical protein [Rhodocyclaceae bacterium]
MMEVRFGYLQEQMVIEWSSGTVRPLDNIASIVERVQVHERAYGDWFHPPLEPVSRDSKETKNSPLVPTRTFSLPATHLLSLKNHDEADECANFVIALFGMLKGRRLQREGWQHFYKAPIDQELCDFCADKSEIAHALDRVSDFWQTHADVDIRRLAFGALHWHLFAQLYEHDFERFNAQYMALDACHKLAKATWTNFDSATTHAKRASALCTQLGVPTPAWANVPTGQRTCALSERRNALIHEAMYGGQPVGFVHPVEHSGMELELTKLVARLLLRLLGIENEYTRSACTTRVTMEFSFDTKR